MLTSPWSLFRAVAERRDQRRACRLRETFGRRGWLVSWQPEPASGSSSGWRARLSCPLLRRTVERVGATRVRAIERAERSREFILALRGGFGSPRPTNRAH